MAEREHRPAAARVGDIVRQHDDLAGLLTRLLDDLPVGIILYDARSEFRVTYANPVMEEWPPPGDPSAGRTDPQ